MVRDVTVHRPVWLSREEGAPGDGSRGSADDDDDGQVFAQLEAPPSPSVKDSRNLNNELYFKQEKIIFMF